MIEVEDLRKTYGVFPAVVGSTFDVDRGEIFSIVGPNGAGKTTTLKMIAGLVEPSAGSATVADFDAGNPVNTVARLAVDSVGAAYPALVAGYVTLGAAAYLSLRRAVPRIGIDD